MSYIRVENSNFLSQSAHIYFSDEQFIYIDIGASSQEITISASDIQSLNRLKIEKVQPTDVNIVWKYIFYGLINLFVFWKVFTFLSARRKLKYPITVHFKNGDSFQGMTDMDTFFEVQNAWLDNR